MDFWGNWVLLHYTRDVWLFCNVALPVPLRTTFTYAIPEDDARAGAAGQPRAGAVPQESDGRRGGGDGGRRSGRYQDSPITKILDLAPALPPKLLELGVWIAITTCAHWRSVPRHAAAGGGVSGAQGDCVDRGRRHLRRERLQGNFVPNCPAPKRNSFTNSGEKKACCHLRRFASLGITGWRRCNA